ncbi:MAG: protein kinase [Sandaracinaceae bacterium]
MKDTSLAERFVLHEELGRGSYGTVYRAFDQRLGMEVAIKVLHDLAPGTVTHLKREYRVLTDLWHPNLCELYDLIADPGGEVVLTMELVDGPDLETFCRPEGRLDVDRLREVVRQVGRGLVALHRAGKVHRDLKASNARVSASGVVKLLDFGLTSESRSASKAAGTIAYLAPEAFEGRISPGLDWYALGVLVYHLMTGELPYRQPWPSTLMERIQERHEPLSADAPADLRALVDGWLRARPEDRAGGELLFGAEGGEVVGREVFVGRAREVEAVRRWLADPGEARVLVVTGPSGVGKTALLRRVLGGRPNLLRSRCHPRELLPFNGFDGALESLARKLQQRRVELAPLPGGSALIQLFPSLAGVTGRSITLAGIAPPAGASAERRLRAFSALRALFRQTESSWTLWIDDAQWLDEDSRALLAALLGDRHLQLWVVLSARSGSPWLDELAAQIPVHALSVEPLDDEALAQLLALAGFGASPTRARSIGRRLGGLPFLALEVAEEGGVDQPEAALRRSLARRLDDLGDESRALFELAVVSPRPVPQRLAAALVGADALRWIGPLRKLRLLRPLDEGDDRLMPYHDTLREVWRETLAPDHIATLHRWAADALLLEDDPDPVLLVEHLREAGDPRAREWATRAAEAASTSFAFERAAELYGLAAAIEGDGPSWDLRVAQGRALARAGFGRSAAETLEQAIRELPPGKRHETQRLGLRRERARHLLTSGELRAGLAALRSLLRDQGVHLPASELRALLPLLRWRLLPALGASGGSEARFETLLLAVNALGTVRPLTATALASRFLAEARRFGDPEWLAYAASMEAIFQANLGRFERSRALQAEIRDVLRRAPSTRLEVWELTTRGVCTLFEGDFAHGAELTREAIDFVYRRSFAEHGLLEDDVARVFVVHMWASVMAGGLRRALDDVRDRLPLAERRRDYLHTDTLRHGPVTIARLAQDRPDDAERQSDLSERRWHELGERTPLAQRLNSQVRIALYRGDTERAWRLWQTHWGWVRRKGLLAFALYGAELRATRACTALAHASVVEGGEARRLARLAAREERRIRAAGVRSGDVLALQVAASRRTVEGDGDGARRDLEALRDAAGRLRLTMHEAMAAWALGHTDTASRWLRREGVVSPERFARLFGPAFATYPGSAPRPPRLPAG